MLKEFIKVIQQEQQTYKDPITEFLECLHVNYDFAGAQQKLIDCEQVSLPFLAISMPITLTEFVLSCLLKHWKNMKVFHIMPKHSSHLLTIFMSQAYIYYVTLIQI
jgi:hypothetical protein